MVPNPSIMQAVEALGYRVTVGDVAAQAGMQLDLAQRELMVLASEAGGHLQVAESGDIAYQFPQNFRIILRNKYFQIQLQEWWEKVWRVMFYLIRISFGIILILLIMLTILAIVVISSSRSSDDRRDNDRSGGDGMVFIPNFWMGDWFWFFGWGDERPYQQRQQFQADDQPQLNFLEAVFSFLFGDGIPNRDLEERRWQAIATTIRNHKGAVIAEQLAPYLDQVGEGFANEYEDYMLPVLIRFNGVPEVSPEGHLVYRFPELQTTAEQNQPRSVAAYLREYTWRFSQASPGQIILAAGLGGVLFILSLALGSSLPTTDYELSTLFSLLFRISLGYSTAYLSIPVIRYFWIQWRNRQIEARNEQRRARAEALNNADATIQQKLQFARQFALETVVSQENLAYTTETGLAEQELAQ